MSHATKPCTFCHEPVHPHESHNEFDDRLAAFGEANPLRFARLGQPIVPVCAPCFHAIDQAVGYCVARGINEGTAA